MKPKWLVEIQPGHWIDTRQPLRIMVHSTGPLAIDIWPRPDFPTPWWLVDIIAWMNNYAETPVRVAHKTEAEARACAKAFAAKINRVLK